MTTRIAGIAIQVEVIDEYGEGQVLDATVVVEDDWTGSTATGDLVRDYLVIRREGNSYGIPLRDAEEALSLAGWVRKHEVEGSDREDES